MSRRRVAVLDVESVPCADSLSQTVRHARGGFRRPALHRVVCASVLVAQESDEGFSGIDLRTFGDDRHVETDIIGFVDAMLPDPHDPGSLLVTYNGACFDLRLLKLRACANWLFQVPALSGWIGSSAARHVDLISEGWGSPAGPLWSLPDLCAGLGFAIRGGQLARSIVHLHSEGRHDVIAEHNRMDVLGTFLAYAYGRSFETGSDLYVATAWTEVSRLLEGTPTVNLGSERISQHHLVSVARGCLAPFPSRSPSS